MKKKVYDMRKSLVSGRSVKIAGMALALYLAAMLVASAAADLVPVYPKRTLFHGVGSSSESMSGPISPVYFQFEGHEISGRAFGYAFWIDEAEGIVVYLRIMQLRVVWDTIPGHHKYIIQTAGEARVHEDGQYIGTFWGSLHFADGGLGFTDGDGTEPQFDWLHFGIFHFYGEDDHYERNGVLVERGDIKVRLTF